MSKPEARAQPCTDPGRTWCGMQLTLSCGRRLALQTALHCGDAPSNAANAGPEVADAIVIVSL